MPWEKNFKRIYDNNSYLGDISKDYFFKNRQDIKDELHEIYQTYRMNELDNDIRYFYWNNKKLQGGAVLETLKFFEKLLKVYLYSDEEIVAFFKRFPSVVINTKSYITTRLSIFERANLMEEVLFSKTPYISNSQYFIGASNELLYAYAKSKDFDLNLVEVAFLPNMKAEYKEELLKEFPLDRKSRREIMIDLNENSKMLTRMCKTSRRGK